MPRNFNGNETITLSKGSNFAGTGAVTYMALLNKNADTAFHSILTGLNGGAFAWEFGFSNDDNLMWSSASDFYHADGTTAVLASDVSAVVAVTKAAGNAVPRNHRFKSGTWVHANNGASNASNVGAWDAWCIGYNAATDPLVADLAWVAVRDVALTDAQIEQAALSWANLLSLLPDAAWVLDQAAVTEKVIDWTGGGANESGRTGTSVSAPWSPGGWSYGHPVRRVQRVFGGATQALAASIAGTGTVAADLSVTKELAASVAGTSTVAADLAAAKTLEATVACVAVISAELALTKALAAQLAGSSAVQADLVASVSLAAALTGTPVVAADLSSTLALAASLAGLSTVAADLATSSDVTLAAAIAGAAAIAAELANAVALEAAPAGAAAVAAELSVSRPPAEPSDDDPNLPYWHTHRGL